MRAKVTKFVLGDIKTISISRFICSEDRLLDIMNLFEYETAIVEIDTVEKNSSLFCAIETLSINYITSLSDELPYTDVVLMIARYNLEELIHYILASESESFLIEGGENESIWEQYLHNQINKRQLMKRKIIKFSMVVLMSEFQVDITFHKDAYNIKQITLKIKETLSDKDF